MEERIMALPQTEQVSWLPVDEGVLQFVSCIEWGVQAMLKGRGEDDNHRIMHARTNEIDGRFG